MKRKTASALSVLGAVVAAALVAAPVTGGAADGKTIVTTMGGAEEGLEISMAAAPGTENTIRVYPAGSTAPTVLVLRDAAGLSEDSPFCVQKSATEVRCDTMASLELLVVRTGDLRDRVMFGEMATARWARAARISEFSFRLGSGRDLYSSGQADTCRRLERGCGCGCRGQTAASFDSGALGQAGNDRLVGGTGDQWLSGGRGSDYVAGGADPGDHCDGGSGDDRGGAGCEEVVSIP